MINNNQKKILHITQTQLLKIRFANLSLKSIETSRTNKKGNKKLKRKLNMINNNMIRT